MPAALEMNGGGGGGHDDDSIAVIGLACRFPGDASNPEHFWEMLCEGRSAYSELNRYNINAFHNHTESKLNTSTPRGAHFLNQDIAAFDANFFTINENEAAAMDPQARLMLEVAYEAFENAGLPIEGVAGTQTSCYIGNFTTDYREMLFRDPDAAPRYSLSGSGQEMISNRISWFYDLRGPSFTLGTACSSSLVALHQACQSLRNHDANMSIVGGCNLLLNPEMFLVLSNMQFLARDGRCKTFDAKGDGYGRGEGFAAVLLKRVGDAIRDGDPIRAIIRGTGVNQDGHTKGITVPSAEAQANLINSVYARAGLGFENTHYVECHGTGTKTGDPLELEAISKTLSSSRKPGEHVWVGSVKPNIGHLEATAGLAGLIKAIYILERGVIPPNILFNDPNPEIPFQEWDLSVPTKMISWPTDDTRRISVQGFGYGGTNAHAVLDDAFHYLLEKGNHASDHARIWSADQANGSGTYGASRHDSMFEPIKSAITVDEGKAFRQYRLFKLSAHDRNGIQRQREALVKYLRVHQSKDLRAERQLLGNLAFTLNEKRSNLAWKTYAVASSLDELIARFQAKESETPEFRTSSAPRLGFVFTGQGAQWAQMGTQLNQYTVFRQSIEESDHYLRSALDCPWSVTDELSADDSQSRINSPAFSQPLCTILQIALVDLLESWNITPTAVIGHSSGEIAGAYCLGALKKHDALKAAYYRGILSARMKELLPATKGAMLAVGASESQAQSWIDELDPAVGEVVVACINSPSSVTLSGDASAINELEKRLGQRQIFARKLKVDVAYHSPHLAAISSQYLESLSDVSPRQSHEDRHMYSSVTGTVVEPTELGAMNWVRNLLSPVLFYDALLEMLQPPYQVGSKMESSVDILLEVGPHSTLQGAVNQTIRKHDIRDVTYLSMLSRGQNAAETAVTAAGALLQRGCPVRVSQLNEGVDGFDARAPSPLTNLPPYAWNHSRTFWAESRVFKEYRQRKRSPLGLIGAPYPKLVGAEHIWRGQIRTAEQPWIQDHKIQTSILYPAAGYLAMAVEAATQIAPTSQRIKTLRLRDIQIVTPAVMSDDSDLECTIRLRPRRTGNRESSATWMEFSVSSCHTGEDLRENCFGLIQVEYEPSHSGSGVSEDEHEFTAVKAAYLKYQQACESLEEPEEFYSELSSIGLNYGPTFRNVTQARRDNGKSCFTITVPDLGLSLKSSQAEREHVIHPTTLDSMFHGVFAAFKGVKGRLEEAMVPTSIEEVVISIDMPSEVGSQFVGFCDASEHGFRDLKADLVMFDTTLSTTLVKVTGFHCAAFSGPKADAMQTSGSTKRNIFSKMVWKPVANLLLPGQNGQPTTSDTSRNNCVRQFEQCESLALNFIDDALATVSMDQTTDTNLRSFYTWMQDQQRQVTARNDFPPNGQRRVDGDESMHDNSEEGPVEVEAIRRLGKNITAVLYGLVDGGQLLTEGGLVYRWWSQLLEFDGYFAKLANHMDLLAHKEPELSVLELGDSTGGAASSILRNDSDTPSTPLSLGRYVFSSSTDAALKEAEERLVAFKGRLEFKSLALDQDPLGQGFHHNSFDVIICSSLISLCNLDKTLTNMKQLLRPGGKVCLIGITHPSLSFSLVSRCLNTSSSERFSIPTDSSELDRLLKRHGYVSQFSDPSSQTAERHQFSLTVATPNEVVSNGVHDRQCIIIEPPETTENVGSLASRLAIELEHQSITPTRVKWGVDFENFDDKECICLVDLEESMLAEINEEDFQKLQRIITSSSKLLWVESLRSPFGGLAAGMARSIRNEMPGSHFATVTVQESSLNSSQRLARQLTQLITEPSTDLEFLEEDGMLKICRVVEDVGIDQEVAQSQSEEKDRMLSIPLERAIGAQKLAFHTAALLDSIHLEPDDLATTALEDDEVEIEVKASGLNFRDVVVVMGQMADKLLGFDASGVITRMGKDVTQFKAGDRVCTLGHGAHRTHFRNKAYLCQMMPESLSFEEAATLPLVHATAYHALINIARIRSNQTILIHAAAGGVGQAAIQLARHFGLEVFATVGSSKKREMIRDSYNIPDDHIFNSRDLSFAKGVLRMTNGRGVDCILNSLSGQALQETWRCIAPFGTFVEIGMRDILDNTRLEMRPFMNDATFSFFNLKNVMTGNPTLMEEIMQGTFDFLRQSVTRPVAPVTTYPIGSVEDAFRLMQTGKHLGKIALSWDKSSVVPVLHRPSTPRVLDPAATYMLVGGFGGLGQSLAHLLVYMGARHLCFLSRSGPTSASAQNLLTALQSQGVSVTHQEVDISDATALATHLHTHTSTARPIKGVIQCAMSLQDTPFASMSHAQWQRSLAPKVAGTFHLHTHLPHDLDFFITLSSFAAIFGNLTQSNYAAAGAFQDALAHHRVAHGLKAVTIDLGIMRDVGVIAEKGITGPLKDWVEPFGIRESELRDLLRFVIKREVASPVPTLPPQILTGFATGGAAHAAGITPPFYFTDPRFSHLARTGLSSAAAAAPLTRETASNPLENFAALATADAHDATARLTSALRARVAKSLQTDASEIDAAKPLHAYGVDSLVAIEIVNWLYREVGVSVGVFEVLKGVGMEEFAAGVVDKARAGDKGAGSG